MRDELPAWYEEKVQSFKYILSLNINDHQVLQYIQKPYPKKSQELPYCNNLRRFEMDPLLELEQNPLDGKETVSPSDQQCLRTR